MLSKSMMIGTVFEEEEVASKKNFYNIAVFSSFPFHISQKNLLGSR